MRFLNGDYKKVETDQTVIYWFKANNTLQTTYTDGLVIYEFSTGQIERTYADGLFEIQFPDGTFKSVNNGTVIDFNT